MARSRNSVLVLIILFVTMAHAKQGGNTSLVKHPLETKEQKHKSHNDVEARDKNRYHWGGGGGRYGGGGGWGWGWGGGGGGWWGWGCRRPQRKQSGGSGGAHKKRVLDGGDYKMGEFAQCMGKGRCHGMRLDCPLHCGGPCLYDCKHMCKAHCRRR